MNDFTSGTWKNEDFIWPVIRIIIFRLLSNATTLDSILKFPETISSLIFIDDSVQQYTVSILNTFLAHFRATQTAHLKVLRPPFYLQYKSVKNLPWADCSAFSLTYNTGRNPVFGFRQCPEYSKQQVFNALLHWEILKAAQGWEIRNIFEWNQTSICLLEIEITINII